MLVPLTTTHLASAFGIFETVECLAKLLGGPVIGAIHDVSGSYTVDLCLFALVLFLAAAAGLSGVVVWSTPRL